ncbi:unnamed protein product [Penicillium salamii]|nr:unnamed protein product [Penicillium salamii]
MPHSESKMGEPIVNGEKHSHFLEHLTSYPVVSDSISYYKGNPYGAKSIELVDHGYTRLAKPVLPYFSAPYSYVAPYLARADSLGDKGLTEIDTRFPIIKEDTQKLRGSIYNRASFPARLAGDAKTHLYDIYGSEYKKCGGDGIFASGKAVVTTSLVLSQESLAWISTFLQTKKEEAKEVVEKNSH